MTQWGDGDRFVLCIPRGCGFNDVLCQIWASYVYALKTGRTLLVDTRLSGMADALSEYMEEFQPSGRVELQVTDSRMEELNRLTCFPAVVQGRIQAIHHVFHALEARKTDRWRLMNKLNTLRKLGSYAIRMPTGLPRINRKQFLAAFFEMRAGKPIFGVKEDRPESVVVHFRAGGGLDSIKTLNLLRLKNEVLQTVMERLDRIGDQDYDAVHIRNTDYITDYRPFLESIKSELRGRTVLVCTDNKMVFEETRTILSESMVVSLSALARQSFQKGGGGARPLHYQWLLSVEQRRENNLAMLTDLVGMACAKRLHFTKLVERGCEGYSGFSLLASFLHHSGYWQDFR